MNDDIYEPTYEEQAWADAAFDRPDNDPVHCSWYFWNELWTYRHGPYESEAEARAALARFVESL
jgi:hypothetical protein